MVQILFPTPPGRAGRTEAGKGSPGGLSPMLKRPQKSPVFPSLVGQLSVEQSIDYVNISHAASALTNGEAFKDVVLPTKFDRESRDGSLFNPALRSHEVIRLDNPCQLRQCASAYTPIALEEARVFHNGQVRSKWR